MYLIWSLCQYGLHGACMEYHTQILTRCTESWLVKSSLWVLPLVSSCRPSWWSKIIYYLVLRVPKYRYSGTPVLIYIPVCTFVRGLILKLHTATWIQYKRINTSHEHTCWHTPNLFTVNLLISLCTFRVLWSTLISDVIKLVVEILWNPNPNPPEFGDRDWFRDVIGHQKNSKRYHPNKNLVWILENMLYIHETM